MEETYGEKFITEEYGIGYESGIVISIVSCESLGDQDIIVTVDNRWDQRDCRDNYIAVKYRQQCIDLFKGYVLDIFGEAEVFYNVAMNGLLINEDVSFNEYLDRTDECFYIYAEIKDSSYKDENQIYELGQAMSSNGNFKYVLRVVIVGDNDYGSYDDISIKEAIEKDEMSRYIVLDNSAGGLEIIFELLSIEV
jgi:hypothetical protein